LAEVGSARRGRGASVSNRAIPFLNGVLGC
jgi:hypothetical protein